MSSWAWIIAAIPILFYISDRAQESAEMRHELDELRQKVEGDDHE